MLKRPYRTYGASSTSWGHSDDAASKAFDLAMQEDQKPPQAPVAWNGAHERGNKRKKAKDKKSESVGGLRASDNDRKRQSSEQRPQSVVKVARTTYKTPKKNWRVGLFM